MLLQHLYHRKIPCVETSFVMLCVVVLPPQTTISPQSPGYVRDPHVKDTVHVILVLVAASEVCTDDVAATIITNLALIRRRGT